MASKPVILSSTKYDNISSERYNKDYYEAQEIYKNGFLDYLDSIKKVYSFNVDNLEQYNLCYIITLSMINGYSSEFETIKS